MTLLVTCSGSERVHDAFVMSEYRREGRSLGSGGIETASVS